MTSVTRRIINGHDGHTAFEVPKFRVEVLSGASTGVCAESRGGELTIGTHQGATLVLDDPTVSRFHLEIQAIEAGVVVKDLGTTNGTFMEALRIREVVVTESVDLVVGQTRLRLIVNEGDVETHSDVPAAFGALFGESIAMRTVFETLARAASTDAPVLITGESGTGKELAARGVHEASFRAEGPFEIVDCGGLPATLIESELFGHEKGAFTGAFAASEGAFERARGGTLFLDELGELPLELQPKLLRVLGERQFRPIGAKRTVTTDVRIVAATNRDLRREVNQGHFRADLFYRLAVIQVKMPPLRERLEDLPMLARALLEMISRERGIDVRGVELDASLWSHAWPGNVRELRNHLEQLAILKGSPALHATEGVDPASPGTPEPSLASLSLNESVYELPLMQAKAEVVSAFEQSYVAKMLARFDGNVAESARRSGVNRATLFRIIRRYGLRSQ